MDNNKYTPTENFYDAIEQAEWTIDEIPHGTQFGQWRAVWREHHDGTRYDRFISERIATSSGNGWRNHVIARVCMDTAPKGEPDRADVVLRMLAMAPTLLGLATQLSERDENSMDQAGIEAACSAIVKFVRDGEPELTDHEKTRPIADEYPHYTERRSVGASPYDRKFEPPKKPLGNVVKDAVEDLLTCKGFKSETTPGINEAIADAVDAMAEAADDAVTEKEASDV